MLPFTGATPTPVVITVIVTVVHTAEPAPGSTPTPTAAPLLTPPAGDDASAQGAAGDRLPTPSTPAPGSSLPVPQPTARPLAVDFAFLQDCGTPTAIFEVRNHLPQSFESAQIYIEDMLTGGPLGLAISDRPFLTRPGLCPPGDPLLPAEGSAFLAVPVNSPQPSGHLARAAISLCAQDGTAGECQRVTVDFVIP